MIGRLMQLTNEMRESGDHRCFRGSLQREATESRRFHADFNNNGDPQQTESTQNFSAVFDVVSKLTSTVQSLQQNVIHLSSRVSLISPANTPAAGNGTSLPPTTDLSSTGSSPTVSKDFNLDTAFARLSSAAAGSAAQAADFKRTRYGFSAESLPMVETISPALRQQITSGKDVNLASLLIPYYNPVEEKDDGKKSDKKAKSGIDFGRIYTGFWYL